ncbi:hypothetical protein BACIH_0795 [Bacillus amyloliquefaciens]|nr:hypothetical protein BACIT_0906 [Bacillus amyloliquefaciens]QEY92569.1 hypothetical protein BACIH_0795 [Bacillus amyloliquefaciens]
MCRALVNPALFLCFEEMYEFVIPLPPVHAGVKMRGCKKRNDFCGILNSN